MIVALHTRVHADKIEEYEAAHREVPEELVAAIHEGGATTWTIWRSGTDLFHVIECEDYHALIAHLGKQAVNVAWGERMAELVDGARDYSSGEGDEPLPTIWRLGRLGADTTDRG